MTQAPRLQVRAVVLDSPDAQALAAFYRRLLGWQVREDEPDWVMLSAPDGGAGLSFQTEKDYHAPVWPATRSASSWSNAGSPAEGVRRWAPGRGSPAPGAVCPARR